MLWGWILTAILSTGASNSQRASNTSSPLFIMVAESMVIFLPMLQLGWLRASAIVTRSSCSTGVFRNGPPEAVRMILMMSSLR